MSLVYIGLPLTVPSPRDFFVNRARRGELPSSLTLWEIALLAVSNDRGEDFDKAREAESLLRSLKAGDRLTTTIVGGKEHADPTSIQVVFSNLLGAGFMGEGLQLWSGISVEAQNIGAAVVRRAPEILETKQLNRQIIGAGHVEKDGRRVAWRAVIENPKVIAAARVNKPASGETSLWDVQEFRVICELQGYVFHFQRPSLSVVDIDSNEADPLAQIPNWVGSR